MDPSAPKSIFISYAREDAPAAERIADALRQRGLEVWYDQDALGSGDAWDQKIRRQIRECALFVPIISRQTEQRPEGYFRLEWKLAVERTHLMADGMPFIAPVVVDSVEESDALVPAAFLRVQWSRLPQGVPTPQFIAQIQRLLQPAGEGGEAASKLRPTALPPIRPQRSWTSVLIAGIGLAALAVAVGLVLHRTAPAPPGVAASATGERVASVDEKSVAVLPLANLSEEKGSGFFADGIHDELITDLAAIADLKVISRTSVLQYRDARENLRTIAHELGVTYIVEGSVRHVGNRVMITAQLIDSRTDAHVWAGTFEKDLPDVFVLQATLARDIAAALQAKLTPAETQRIERSRGATLADYELVQRAREIIFNTTASREDYFRAIDLAKQAVENEPKFALGWATLGHVGVALGYRGFDATRARATEAKAAIDRALALDPNLPEAHWALGRYYENAVPVRAAEQSVKEAQAELELARAGMPNEPRILADISSVIFYANGSFEAAIALQHRAVELNPNDPLAHYNLARMLVNVGRNDEAMVAFDDARRLSPLFVNAVGYAVYCRILRGDLADADRVLGTLPASIHEDRAVYFRYLLAYYHRDAAAANRILETSGLTYFRDNQYFGPREYLEGEALAMAGDPGAARAKFLQAQAAMQHEGAAATGLDSEIATRALIAARLGDETQALQCLTQLENTGGAIALGNGRLTEVKAQLYVILGQNERAVDALEALVNQWHWESAGSLRLNPQWDPLQTNPRFRALLATGPGAPAAGATPLRANTLK